MAYFHITSSGAANKVQGRTRKVRVQVNAALTGSITLSDETGTAGSPAVAVITNPTVGSQYEYWDLQTGLTINPSTTCDITVSTDSSYGSH